MPKATSDEFRHAIGHFATGVSVITTAHDGRTFGTTASAVMSVSLEPPMLVIAMNRSSVTGQAIAASGVFAVNVLDERQRALAEHFASKHPEKLRATEAVAGALGQPLLDGALAALECRVTTVIPGGTHSVFLAEVESVRVADGTPLAYFRGRFGRLELD
jgi:flavin reductase (DIM6/NTAB) family NADH-FMN oxidoreductase RutF